jgi:hypothetical protein
MQIRKLLVGVAVGSSFVLSLPVFAEHTEVDVFGRPVVIDNTTLRPINFSKSLTRSGKDLDGNAEWNTEIQARIDRVIKHLAWVNVQVPTEVCDTVGNEGKGSSPLWDRFYSARKDQKAAALADAVKGIGESTAKKLVEDGYFDSKPRSWAAFKDVIRAADRDYKTGFSNEVLNTFGNENIKALGYYDSSRLDCRIVFVNEQVLREVETTKPHSFPKKAFNIKVEGAPLINGENEEFTLNYNGIDDSLQAPTQYNSYQVSRNEQGGVVNYTLKGNRKQISPQNSLAVTPRSKNGKLVFDVVDSAFDPALGTQMGKTVIHYKVQKDKFGPFNSNLGKGAKTLSTSSTDSTVDTGISVKPGTNLRIEYSLQRTGSTFFNSNKSREKVEQSKANN